MKSTLSTKTLARMTGFFYLLIIACGLMSGLFVREALIDPASAGTTFHNLVNNQSLFRLGFLGDVVMVLSDVMVSVLFYFLLKDVHAILAALAAVFRLMQSAILGANLVNLFQPILMIQGVDPTSTAQSHELGRAILAQMQVFDYGYLVSGVFFAINCLLMGILLFKAPAFPRILGGMIFIGGIGYLFNCMAHFIAPSLILTSEMVMLLTAVVSELALCLYLLIAGARENKTIAA